MLPGSLFAEGLDPYILAGIDQGTRQEVQTRVEERLTAEGFEILGSYSPAGDENLGVICVTNEHLKASAVQSGGLHGFAAVLRVGLIKTDSGIEVSYTNPLYWGNAYYRKEFPQVEEVYILLDQRFRTALADLSDSRFEAFGSRKGMTPAKLRKYHYMITMPYFHDVVVLDKGSSYGEAVARIESRAAAKGSEVKIVYSIKFPEQEMALFGTALTGENGETKFLPKIDFKDPRHIPFLPYEMLVLKDKVVSLHGKYRIALSFPDLSMGTFMKIVSTPGDIANAQRTVASK
ncbi:MAG: hypothetical protein DRP71_02755 [Verrucomicrobia bacterium]|nr:MAG: hypothetical protein DRP71_02755 [Verrucomicrobiota bacterium]